MKKSTHTDPRSSRLVARYHLDHCAHLLSGSERSMLRSRSIEAQFYAVKNSIGITPWCLLSTRRSFFVGAPYSASQNWLENSTIRDSTEHCNCCLNEESSPTPGRS